MDNEKEYSMDSKESIERTLSQIMREFEAEGAWCGHCYGVENFETYYNVICEYLRIKSPISYFVLKAAYDRTVTEITTYPHDEEQDERINYCDQFFLDTLASICQAIKEKEGIEEEYLQFV